MSTLLFLSSREQEGTLSYDAHWNIDDARLNGSNKPMVVSLDHFEVPNAVYPINATNNKVQFTTTDGTYTATLTSQSYTGNQLATELKTQMDAAGSGGGTPITFTVSYSSQTGKLTFAPSAGTVVFVTVTNDAYDSLGIDRTNFQAAASSISSDFPINVAGTQYIDLVTNLSTLNHSSSSYASVLARVPMNVAWGEILYFMPASAQRIVTNAASLRDLRIQLRDDRGALWALPDNAFMSLTLRLE